jgi:large subunit ribosomal protein L35
VLYCWGLQDLKNGILPELITQDILTMPKLKSHRGAAKRFKKTGTGKIVRHHAYARHILTSKARSRKRKLAHSVVVDPTNAPRLRVMLPY